MYHPAFNVDAEDASIASTSFSTHVKAVSRSVQGLRSVFGKVREARLEMARAERGLGYAILGMITAPFTGRRNGISIIEEEEEENEEGEERERCKGVVNNDGAWCWREDCKGRCIIFDLSHQRLTLLQRMFTLDEKPAETQRDFTKCC